MATQRYLIVGGGMTGHAAAAAIRESDPEGAITMVSAEPDRPYARPPLSKGMWLGKPEDTIWLPEVPAVELHAGRRAVAIDLAARAVRDDAGRDHPYDRLLLATGGVPRRLPVGGDRIVYFRTIADYRRLRGAGREVVVIGGGFIGSELAAALAQTGRSVTMIFPEEAVGARAYPKELADALTRTFEERGVRVLAGETVAEVEERGDRVAVRTARGEELVADAVVAGLGIRPNTALAEAAGIRCSDGIEVDERLETSAPGVFAAGDVARFPCRALGERVRIEHEDAALTMGRAAARNMAGASEPYDHLPFFYSDMFDLGYEAVGRLDARLETVASWKTPFREGVV
jgi:3-phenylpropionate/trans-cinnamate dioxygenase ferredoxin reductase component